MRRQGRGDSNNFDSPLFGPYPPECVEEDFSEVRVEHIGKNGNHRGYDVIIRLPVEEGKGGGQIFAETMPTFVVGDYITYGVYLAYPTNLREVTAHFRNEKSEDSIFLSWRVGGYTNSASDWTQTAWEEELAPHPRIKGTRTHVVVLSGLAYKSYPPGMYRFDTLTAKAYLKKELTIDSPQVAFRLEQEPDISVLPSSAVLWPTGFHFPEGHPDRPQEE
jgi:hypothetical protein